MNATPDTCPTCGRPKATVDDSTAYSARPFARPSSWSDDVGSHLCWRSQCGEDLLCIPLGGRAVCVVCERPVATEEDRQTFEAHGSGDTTPEGSCLCWRALFPSDAACASEHELPDQPARFLGAIANLLGDHCPPPDAPPEAWIEALMEWSS